MRYVDGFVLPVPKKKLRGLPPLAQKAGKIWREHGALEVCECVADDVKVGKLTSFPAQREVEAGRDGGLLLDRLQVAGRPRSDQREGHGGSAPGKDDEGPARTWPFDAKRMIYGGFEVLVTA